MLFFYGSRKIARNKRLSINPCPNCGSLNTVQLATFFKYAHFFFVPCFPMSRFGVSKCAKCGQEFRESQMPEPIKSEMKMMNKERPVPIWSYSGLILFIGLITLAKTSSDTHEKNVPLMIANPQKGDILTIKVGEKEYGLMRIDSIIGDSLHAVFSNYTSERESSAYRIKLKGDRAFSHDKMTAPISRIKEMYDEKIIVNIQRD